MARGFALIFSIVAAASVPAAEFIDALPSDVAAGLEDQIGYLPDGRRFVEIDDMRLLLDDAAKSVSDDTAWTDGTVYYQFDPNVDAVDGRPLSGNGTARRAAWVAAANEWQNTVPGLSFVEGTGSGNYILVKSADFNNSFVGMIDGAQDMNIYQWNYRFIMAHEIGHALGLLHEQSRSNRGSFVTIHLENVQDAAEPNYGAANGTSINHGPYDYGSSMHYGRCTFWDDAAGECGTDGFTMDAVSAGAGSVGLTEGQANDLMGQRYELSSGDIAGIRSRYPSGTDAIFPDGFDAGHTRAWSSVVGESMSCPHDFCDLGEPLHPACDPCSATVYERDSWCGEATWDSICIAIAEAFCPVSCS